MKILYIGGFELPDRNAAAHRVLSVGRSLRQAGHDVEYIGVTRLNEETGKRLSIDGFSYTTIPYPAGTKAWFYHISHFIPLQDIEEAAPDVVILYNLYALAQRRIIKYCRKRNIRVIGDITEWYHVTGLSPRALVQKADINLRMRRYNFRLDGIIAISRFLYDFYSCKVPTVCIPPTVDYSESKFSRDRELTAHNPIRLVYAGSPGSEKDRLSQIINAIEGNSRFSLDVIGISANSTSNIRFHGRVSHPKALKFVKDADFQVIFRPDNLVTRAGFPTKFVESLACGIPVIATPSSNICDFLRDGYNGFVISGEQDIAACLRRIAGLQPDDLIQMKHNSLQTTDFDFNRYVDSLNSLLNSRI